MKILVFQTKFTFHVEKHSRCKITNFCRNFKRNDLTVHFNATKECVTSRATWPIESVTDWLTWKAVHPPLLSRTPPWNFKPSYRALIAQVRRPLSQLSSSVTLFFFCSGRQCSKRDFRQFLSTTTKHIPNPQTMVSTCLSTTKDHSIPFIWSSAFESR